MAETQRNRPDWKEPKHLNTQPGKWAQSGPRWVKWNTREDKKTQPDTGETDSEDTKHHEKQKYLSENV